MLSIWNKSNACFTALLCSTFDTAATSSLPVERKFAETKRREAPRLCSVATASRSQLLRQFLRDREVMLGRLSRAEAHSVAAKTANVHRKLW